MLASLLRRSQLPGENENGNWPVCKAPVTLELGDVNPRHFLRCKTCTRPVLRRGALILIDHQQNRQRPPPPPPPLLLLSLSRFLSMLVGVNHRMEKKKNYCLCRCWSDSPRLSSTTVENSWQERGPELS